MANYIESECKTLINRMKENLFTVRTYSVRLTANLYSGCVFDCPYCYAPFIHKFNKNASPEEFGSKIFVKKNALNVLEKQIERIKKSKDFRNEYVDLGTITDCYQPMEKHYQLTRGTIEILKKHDMPVTILTKSDLVVRDIDLLQELAERNRAAVGFSITTSSVHEKYWKSFLEPGSPSTQRRLDAIRKLRKAGIPTYVFVNPVVPYLSASKESISELFKEIKDTGNDSIFFGVMKLNPLTWGLFRKRLEKYDPSLADKIQTLYIKEGEKEFGRSWVPSYNYRNDLYTMARELAIEQELGFSCEGGFYHLWLNDWAEIESGFNYPSGYNFWLIIKKKEGQLVGFEEFKKELESKYSTLRENFLLKLLEFWCNGKLFIDLRDIQMIKNDKGIFYKYCGGK